MLCRPANVAYTGAAASKKGAVGIGVPQQLYDRSRRTPAVLAAFFVPQFWRLGWRAARPPVLARAARHANSVRAAAPIGVGATVL